MNYPTQQISWWLSDLKVREMMRGKDALDLRRYVYDKMPKNVRSPELGAMPGDLIWWTLSQVDWDALVEELNN